MLSPLLLKIQPFETSKMDIIQHKQNHYCNSKFILLKCDTVWLGKWVHSCGGTCCLSIFRL